MKFNPGDIIRLDRYISSLNAPLGSLAEVLSPEGGLESIIRNGKDEPLVYVRWLKNLPIDGGQSDGDYCEAGFTLVNEAICRSMPDTRDYLNALSEFNI